jgi:hypothetical protein
MRRVSNARRRASINAVEVTFTSLDGLHVTTIERDDGAVLATRSPGARDRLPHDLIHYVVERELGLDDGVWGRVASGVVYKNFRVLQPPKAKQQRRQKPRKRKTKRKGVLEAEVLVWILHDIWDGTAEREWGTIRAFLDSIWSPRTRSRADELEPSTIARICAALDRMEAKWKRVPVGGELRVDW